MPITQTIGSLGTPPSTSDPTNFPTLADALLGTALPARVTEMNTWATQANALAAAMNAVAAGTALAIPLTFSTTTTDSDPGAGYVRLDNATQNLATTIRTDLIGSDGSTWTDVINLFDDSTSTIKGFITLKKLADATKFLIFSVSALASPSGYKNITVANVAYSAASPFADGDALVLEFSRNGDKGETGATGSPGASATAASQAQMESASDNTVMATPLNTKWHPGVAKAWLQCGVTGNVLASHNITSITDDGTGVVTVTLNADISGANWVINVSVFASALIPGVITHNDGTGFTARCKNLSDAATDPTYWYFTCFGDQ